VEASHDPTQKPTIPDAILGRPLTAHIHAGYRSVTGTVV
jgi:hypothetical protein